MCKLQESIASTVQNVLSRVRSFDDAELLVDRSALESTLRDRENQPMLLEPEVQFVPKLIFDRKRLQDLLAPLNKEVRVINDVTCAENTIITTENSKKFPFHRAWCGRENFFTIIALDAQKRRRCLGGDLFMVELKDEFGNEKATGSVEDRGDGSYSATYFVPEDAEPGDYTLNVCLAGVHIRGSPFKVHVYWPVTSLSDFVYRKMYGAGT